MLAAGWQSAAVRLPRLLAVWIHELGHASAAWLTGGAVDSIAVGADLAGATVVRGGVPALVHLGGPAANLLVGGLAWWWGHRRLPSGRGWLWGGLGALNLLAALVDAVGEFRAPGDADDSAALAGALGGGAGGWAAGLAVAAVVLLLLPLRQSPA